MSLSAHPNHLAVRRPEARPDAPGGQGKRTSYPGAVVISHDAPAAGLRVNGDVFNLTANGCLAGPATSGLSWLAMICTCLAKIWHLGPRPGDCGLGGKFCAQGTPWDPSGGREILVGYR